MAGDGALDRFVSALPFRADAFQLDALASCDAGRNVVVTAPTGAGKTLVADGAIAIARGSDSRAFYTTPIKALSNQKYRDLVAVHGPDDVGLLTGDNVINGDAPIVVMTTEVLRNMIYEGSFGLHDIAVVILDEVHYLADRHRGSVWEEIIIHLDTAIPVVCLSATIANPEEFTEWIRARRGHTDLIVESHRPVPLTSMYMWNDRHDSGPPVMLPIFAKGGRPNPAVTRQLGRSKGRRARFVTPRRLEVVDRLRDEGLLPAIYFVFSRKGCDATAEQLASSHLGLTTADDRSTIREVVRRHTEHLSDEDLTVLGFERWSAILEQGVGAHHAGLVPAYKETVEELFLRGLVKVVAATETLALGINMPARTVVLESLSKFNGETHELLAASDYTQLTGRAGRRGIDVEGTAVVLHSSYVPFERVSGIAAAGSTPLRSSFAATYNMTVNLIARYDESRAHELLAASFANFSEQHRHRQLEENLELRRSDAETFLAAASCSRGDIWAVIEAGTPRRVKPRLDLVEPGTVVEFGGHTRLVLGRSLGGSSPRVDLTDPTGHRERIRSRDLPRSTMVLGHINLPSPVRASDATYRREAGLLLESFVPLRDAIPLAGDESDSGVLACPDLDTHIEWAERAARAERDVRRLERRLARMTRHDVVTDFDKLHAVLDEMGYTTGWKLEPPGIALRRLYNELDLVLSETLRSGVLDGLDAAEFAAIVSVFTYETRGGDAPEAPRAAFAAEPLSTIGEIGERMALVEQRHGLDPTRPPDLGLVDVVHGWARGLDLDELFDTDDVRAGDFVRATRQVLDLLRQVRDGFPAYRTVASAGIVAIDRGIVDVGLGR